MPILASYVDQALAGEGVMIARAVKPHVRLVPFQTQPAPRLGGFLRG
jgi:antitoxin (DNA-binding transcriptional repressor) of toxin-antitoxin stability system